MLTTGGTGTSPTLHRHHIAALGEVRFAAQGSLTEHGAGYTLYWSAKRKEDRRLSEVGFMLKNTLASKPTSLSVGYSDRPMSLYLALQAINSSVCTLSHLWQTLRPERPSKVT